MKTAKSVIALLIVSCITIGILPNAMARGSDFIVFSSGCNRAYTKGSVAPLADDPFVQPFLVDGKTYIPLEFTIKAAGASFNLFSGTNIIEIATQSGKKHFVWLQRETLYQRRDSIRKALIQQKGNTWFMQAEQLAEILEKDIFIHENLVYLCEKGVYPSDEQQKEVESKLYFDRPSAATIINDLMARNPQSDHPRLYARTDDFERVRETIENDSLVKSWYDSVKRTADAALLQPPYRWELRDGIRLLYVSQDVTARINALAMVYQVEKNPIYAERAFMELKAVSEYPNWTVDHWLDLGQMLHAVALGYDWIYEYMTEKQRTEIKNAIVTKGLNRYRNSYAEFDSGMDLNPTNNFEGWWTRRSTNWNPWCNSGAILAALVVGDEEPELASYIIERALASLELSLPELAPDGGSAEGVGYGSIATGYFVKTIAAMDSALGTDYGYFNAPGYPGFAYFLPYMMGTNVAFNYHDSGTDAKAYLNESFYIAKKMNDPALANMRKNDIENKRTQGNMFDIIWYNPDNLEVAQADMPLDKYFRKVETGSFRSSWTDPNAIWLGFHGGDSSVGHAHLDSGTFVFDAMGLNWALDLGSEPLTYTGTAEQKGDPYLLYRFAPQGHNTLQINRNSERGQILDSISPIIDYKSEPSGAFAKMDLTPAYAHVANSAIRGFGLLENRSKILIQDELNLKQTSDIWWLMHTRATIEVSEDGKSAVLHQKGKRMRAAIVSPAEGNFYAMEAEPLPGTPTNIYQADNTGVQKLALNIPSASSATIAVEFTPIYNNFDLQKPIGELVPLSKWEISGGEINLPKLEEILVDNVPIEGFDTDITSYNVPLIVGAETLPTVTAKSSHRIEIIQPDNAVEAMANIIVYDDKNETRNIYNLYFSIEPFRGLPSGVEKANVSRITASDEQVDDTNKNYAVNVNDGDMGTRWSADGEQWIMLELEKTIEVAYVSIAYYSGEVRKSYFDIEVSTDQKEWKRVYGGETSGTTSEYETYPLEPTSAKYIRINGHGNSSGSWNSISEISIFGK